jgi:signal recognition particle subunit SRP54
MLSLIEQVEQRVDKDKADQLASKIKKGETFTLIDFREQLVQMSKAGGLKSLAMKLPGMSNLSEMAQNQLDDKTTIRMKAMIDSMTPIERRKPDTLLNVSRKKRIAAGAGVEVPEVNKMLKQFTQMQKMMKKMGDKGKMMKMMRTLQNRMPMGGGGGMGGMGGRF